MSVLRHTWQGRRIIRQFVIVMLLLAGQITLASCRHPGAQARGLARQGVTSLRVGMTRAQVIGRSDDHCLPVQSTGRTFSPTPMLENDTSAPERSGMAAGWGVL
jgi:hypothetical protein